VAELFAFIEATQAGEWGRLAKLHGGEARARERFADRLAKDLDARGTIPYEPGANKTPDLALFVNGVPVATAELKNALTGQGVEDAKEQYRKGRDPKNITLGRRVVVHFAVDTEQVAMTTRLEGPRRAFCRSIGATTAARATRPTRAATAPPTCGRGFGRRTPGSTCWGGSSTSRGRLKDQSLRGP
jgi:hypothetical protein